MEGEAEGFPVSLPLRRPTLETQAMLLLGGPQSLQRQRGEGRAGAAGDGLKLGWGWEERNRQAQWVPLLELVLERPSRVWGKGPAMTALLDGLRTVEGP